MFTQWNRPICKLGDQLIICRPNSPICSLGSFAGVTLHSRAMSSPSAHLTSVMCSVKAGGAAETASVSPEAAAASAAASALLSSVCMRASASGCCESSETWEDSGKGSGDRRGRGVTQLGGVSLPVDSEPHHTKFALVFCTPKIIYRVSNVAEEDHPYLTACTSSFAGLIPG